MCNKMFCLLFFVFLVTLVFVDTSLGLDPSLVGWWKLDEGSGLVASDSSGNGNDGTIGGSPNWIAAGKIDGALEFNGTDCYINVGNGSSLQIRDEITIAFWIKSSGFGSNGWAAIISKGDGSWRMSRSANTGSSLHMGVGGTTVAGNTYFDATTEVTDNEWHHGAGVYDGSRAIIYIDGVEDASISATGQLASASQDVLICDNADYSGQRLLAATLDDIQLYNRALTPDEIQTVMKGLIDPGLPTEPYPSNAADDISRDVVLSWTPGQFADKHNVYFGTSFDDVNNADSGSPLLIGPGISQNTLSPGRLDFNQTYYWRVDEVNAPPDSTVFKGDIWSFTAEPFAFAIPAANITPTASSQSSGQGPEKTIDGSGLDANDLHSIKAADMWLSTGGDPGSAWIQYEFSKPYKLDEMLIWNYNGNSILALYGIKEVTIEYSADGITWTQANVSELPQAIGEEGYAADTIVPFDGEEVKYVKITADNNHGGGSGFFNKYGLSEVRFMYIPVRARKPSPESAATDVAIDTVVIWRSGREAGEHKVYISTDQDAVLNGTAPVVTVTQASYGPLSLDLGSDNFWRIDEVNNAEADPIWQGDVWSFSTQEYLVVDDFESYNDINTGEEGSNLVYETWVDGYDNPSANGSTMGYSEAFQPSMESDTVHDGEQSAPLTYDNTIASKSEVTVSTSNLSVGSNWTIGAPETLVLWFHGDPNNAVTEQMYVKINSTKVLYDGDAANVARRRWTQWNIDLAASGVNRSSVTSLIIGFERTGATGGSGTVLIDDIRLYRSAPLIPTPTDPGTDGLVAYYAMENNVQDGSGNGLNGIAIGSPTYVSGPAGYGMAIQLNGTDQAVDLGNKAEFNPVGSLSISLWANIGAWTTAWEHVMVSNRGEGSIGWQVRRHSSTSLCFTTRGVGNDDTPSSIVPPLNEWIHIACVYDNVNNTKRIYINGVEDTVVDTNPGTIGATTHNTYIGARANSGNTAQETRFTGMIDEVRIYNRPLSDGEVLFLAD
jgi:hypothetical protein